MPPEMSISMRHTKLKAEEAALLSGEITKPSWQSRNEGIHERVSFEDAIWGFDLAGGAFYKTPLRVTYVKPDSRAEKAGIRPGDKLTRINDIDTSTLTIQEAHKIIIDSGIHLKLAVTAPEDEEDSYFCYEDPIEDGYDSEEERRLEEEKARKRQVHARVSSYWSLQWPWVSKRRVIYRESNCFMVPSKYEDKHKENFPAQSAVKFDESIVFDTAKPRKQNKRVEIEEFSDEDDVRDSKDINNRQVDSNIDVNNSKNHMTNGNGNIKINGTNGNLGEISEEEEDTYDENINYVINSKDNNLSINGSQDDVIENDNDASFNNEHNLSEDDAVINEMVNGLEEDEIDDNKILDDILSDSEEHDNSNGVDR